MKNIAVIGAGCGGLQAAKVLAENGWNVTVYEKSSADTLSLDRWDTVSKSVFDELEIPVPEGSFKDGCLAFTAPFSDKKITLDIDEEKRAWTVDRRVLSARLVKSAENAGAKVIFNTEVQSLLTDNTAVRGIVADGKEIKADLVIDSSGVFSPFRASLPERFGITARPDKKDVFFTWDALFDSDAEAPFPDYYGFLMHLKYTGLKCVAWCVEESENKCAVFIGKTGSLTQNEFADIFSQLNEDYPFIGTNILRGGSFAAIPIRYPLTKMIADGYAAVGDAAFMAAPLVGCGIANSLRAGQILGEVIVKSDSTSQENLWSYQVKYFQNIGAPCCFVDCIKEFLLNADNEELKAFFESEIITDEELKNLLSGRISILSAGKIYRKIKDINKSKHLLNGLTEAALRGIDAMRIAVSIPNKYNPIKIRQWQTKLEKAMR